MRHLFLILALAAALVPEAVLGASGPALHTGAAVSSGSKIPILMYHHVRVDTNMKDKLGVRLSLSPALFRDQLDALQKAGYRTKTFAGLHTMKSVPPKTVILTFDDGYDNAATAVLPELQKRGMTGVFFIISGKVGKPGYMTEDQLKILRDAGMELGAHTVTHPNLARLSPGRQQTEIWKSIDYLRSNLGVPVISFAYPMGKYNASAEHIVKRSGIVYAVTTHHGFGDLASGGLTLRRLRILATEDGKHLLRSIGDASH